MEDYEKFKASNPDFDKQVPEPLEIEVVMPETGWVWLKIKFWSEPNPPGTPLRVGSSLFPGGGFVLQVGPIKKSPGLGGRLWGFYPVFLPGLFGYNLPRFRGGGCTWPP